jgi:mono/diheme cytochrome c family protein
MVKVFDKLPAVLVTAVVAGGVAIVGLKMFSSEPADAIVSVKVPSLSPTAVAGKSAFDATCAQCHGSHAAGTDKGPPLVHDIYNPGHHADHAFVLAAQRGVRQHHWPFGDMPPQAHVSEKDIGNIIRYVRELQAANGIRYRPHNM